MNSSQIFPEQADPQHSDLIKFQPIKSKRAPLQELPVFENGQNNGSSDIPQANGAWEHSPEADELYGQCLKPKHLNLYSKFSATISSFEEAYMKENKLANPKTKVTKAKTSVLRKHYKRAASQSSKCHLSTESKQMPELLYNEETLSQRQSTDQCRGKENKEAFNKDENLLPKQSGKSICEESVNYLNSGCGGLLMSHPIKKVEINFAQNKLESQIHKYSTKLFQPLFNVGRSLNSKNTLKVEKQKLALTAKYIRRRLASSNRNGLQRASSQSHCSEVTKGLCQKPAKQSGSDHCKQSTKLTSRIRLQNVRENSSKSCSALNSLIFDFLNKEDEKRSGKLKAQKGSIFQVKRLPVLHQLNQNHLL